MEKTEYPKIETLYERDPATFKVRPTEIKNRTYSLISRWQWTEKVDGTNIRCMWNPVSSQVTFGGRTNDAQIHADLVKCLYEAVTPEKLRAAFPAGDSEVVIYGEGYGAGIQKGGGLYSPTKKLIVFDVLVGSWWLSYENVVDVADKLGLNVVPDFGVMSLDDATALVREGFESRCAETPRAAEGLVGRPLETLYDKKHARIITKLKTKDF